MWRHYHIGDDYVTDDFFIIAAKRLHQFAPLVILMLLRFRKSDTSLVPTLL
jgi:hypothetical protein